MTRHQTKTLRIRTYPKQQAFIECQKLLRGFFAGIGAGKSRAGAIDMLLRSRANSLYMVVAPTYKMLDRATFRTFTEVAESFGVWNNYRVQERRALCDNGAEYLFCSAEDPDSLRGPNASGVWMDEVQDTKEDAYTILLGRLREHGKRGWLTATLTPGSPDHWTSRTFINGFVPQTMIVEDADGPVSVPYSVNPNGDIATFRASLKENTFLEPEFYEGLVRSYAASPLRIRRELEGECVYLEGAEWLPEYFENCDFDEWPSPDRGGIKVLSLDSSKGKGGKTGDYSAFVKMFWVDGLLYLDADMRNDRDSTVISGTGVELFCQWQPHYFVVEEEMGQDLLITDMHRIADERKIFMPITPMGSDRIPKEVRIRRWTPYISRRQLRFKSNSPGAQLLKEQFQAFPLGVHDDGPDAAEYGLRMLVKATTGQVLPPRQAGLTPMGQSL
jgi:phage terminase large subunit-like protein